MKIIFIGGFYPKEYIELIRKNSIGPIPNANNALQWAYIDGLKSQLNSSCDQLQLISVPQIGAYPFRYKNLFFSANQPMFGEKQGLKGICLSFINIVGFKHISRYYAVRKTLSEFLCQTIWQDDVIIVIYDLQHSLLKAVVDMKRRYKKLRCCLIVPDIHGLTGGKKDLAHRIFERVENRQLEECYKVIDSYVLISKHMVERLPIGDKPWIVIEGIYNPNDTTGLQNRALKATKNIFYSGALDERNGVRNLLDAFALISDPTYRLVLCGDGYMRDEIEDAAKQDLRIEFKGQVDRTQVLALQQEATLLVNPRLSCGDFTRYSFPSKTMEYFGSSIPVLMYRLNGTPEEYYNYCYIPKDESIEELKNSIIEICNLSDETLQKKGESAREFVKTKKNSAMQAAKLLKLINK